MLRILLLTVLIASTIPEAPADGQRPRKAATPAAKTTDPGGYFKKKGENTLPSESWPQQDQTTRVPGLDYEPRRSERFDDRGSPTGMNLLSNRIGDVQFRLRIKHASNALDDWARKVEEYGNVTMSSPILTGGNDGFEFAIKENAQTFFDNAKSRKDGGAAAVLAIVNQFSASGQATFDPLSGAALSNSLINSNAEAQLYQQQMRANINAQKAKDEAARMNRDAKLDEIEKGPGTEAEKQQKRVPVLNEYANAIQGTANKPSPTTTELGFPDTLKGPSDTEKAAAQKEAEATAAAFKPFTDAVLAGDNPAFFPKVEQATGLPDRAAMIDAAGTNTVKAIFKILGNPAAAMQFYDKAVLFATVTVAVNPGWRTKKDFAADISGQASYRMVKARTDVVDAFKNRLPTKQRACIMQNHGLGVPAAWSKKTTTAPAADDSPALQKAKLALASAKASTARLQAEYGKAIKDLPELSAIASQAITPHLTQSENAPSRIIPPGNAPRVATSIGTTLPAGTKVLGGGSEIEQDRFAKDAEKKVKQTMRKVTEPGVWQNPHRIAEINDDLAATVEVLDAANAAIHETPAAQKTVEPIAQSNIEKTRALKAAVGPVETPARQFIAAQSAEVVAGDLVADLTPSPFGGGTHGSGDGAGDAGALKITNEYFDRVSFNKQPPLVAGISPLMETQVLDLKDRFGRQDQITIALAAAFRQNNVKGAASIFERFMKTQTKSAATLSSLPVVNTCSASGGLFGFQVGPRLRALEDPAARKGGSANVLDRQSFPAVLIIGIDRADLSPRICRDYDGKYYLFEPQLVIKQTSRWNPLDGRLFTSFKTTWWNPFAWHNARYSERERVDDLLNVADNFRDLTQWLDEEDTRMSAHANGQRFSDVPAASVQPAAPEDDSLAGLSKDSPPKPTTSKTGAKAPLCEDPESVIYNNDFTRHAYADVVQSLVRRRNALKELSTGSESRQYLPLALLKEKEDAPEVVKEPRLAGLIPPSIAVTLPSGPPATNAAAIAQDKVEALEAVTRFGTAAGFATTFHTQTSAGIDKIMTDETAAKALYKAAYNPVGADQKPREATDAEVQTLRSRLLDVKTNIDGLNTALGTAKTRVTEMQGAVNAATTVIDTVTQLAAMLEGDASRFNDKIDKVRALDATEIPAFRKDKIDPGSLTKHARDAHAELAKVKTPAQKLVADSTVGVTTMPIYFAITGENMQGLKRVTASVPNTVLSFADVSGVGDGGTTTRLEGNAVLFRAILKVSGVVHFRLDFEVKDPAHPTVPIKRVLFTPPLVLSLNGTPPVPTGSGYFDAKGATVSLTHAAPSGAFPDAAPDSLLPSPSLFPANSIPRTATAPTLPEDENATAATAPPSGTSRTRRLAQRLEPDFSTELFPALPEK